MQVIEFFDRGARLNPDGVAFVRPDGSSPITYTGASETTHRVAAALHRAGLADGAPVAVLSPNSPGVFPVVLGIMRAGATWVALNARSSPRDIAALLQTVEARALLYAQRLTEVVDEVRAAVPSLELSLAVDQGEFENWLAPPGTRAPLPPSDPEAVAALFGTGGTTGRAKAVEVPNRAFETMIHGLNLHMPEVAAVHLVAAPLTHAAGALMFPVLSCGGTNVIHDGVRPEEIFESIERNKITRLFLPPTAIYALLADPAVREADTSTLRYFMYGAAPMSVDKLKEAIDVFGPVMAQFYGQVEAPMICTFVSPEEHARAVAEPALEHRLASCGRPSMVANVAIMGEGGATTAAGPRGEIVVRSALTMKGYRGDEAQTAATRRSSGWHGTGDVGYFDEDGYLYIVDRVRDLIITGGFNVYPSEVEQVLWAHPAVRDCAVIGVPDEKWGERVTAVVELKEGAHVEPEELLARCRAELGSVKAPKVIVYRDLPRSAVGKVLKRNLRDEYWAGRERQV